MQNFDNIRAIGLMCDTSLEGIDAAVITTNGLDSLLLGQTISRPYDEYLIEQIKEIRGKDYNDFPKKLKKAEYDLTAAHVDIVKELLLHAGLDKSGVGVIGFHGLTLHHNPKEKETFQLGNPRMLADETGIRTVARFRNNDLLNGGYGAPLTSIYLSVLYAKEQRPLAVLNIGGATNVTFINEHERLSAGTIGPGTALLNDFMAAVFNSPMDYDGQAAATGKIDEDILRKMADDEYFSLPIPKSTGRTYFNRFHEYVKDLPKWDGIATLTALVALIIVKSVSGYPKVIVSGGGTKNPTLMRMLKTNADFEIISCRDMGIEPRMIEPQAYAYLAVRNLYGLPASFPETTGAASATICGTLYGF